MLAIRHPAGADMPAVTAIVRGLPGYFTSDVPGLIERDSAGHDSWVLTDSGTVAGFVRSRPQAAGRLGAQAYVGDQVRQQLIQVASDVRSVVVTGSGHNIALENPAVLAQAWLDFFACG